jgi:thioredoxin-related protein
MQKFKTFMQILAAMVAIAITVQPVLAQAETAGIKHTASTGKSLGAVETEYPSWFHDGFLNLKDDIATARRERKRLMIVFTQDGCPYCNALVERNLAQKDIEALVRDNYEVVALNMLGDREITDVDGKGYTEKTFAATLKVQFTPTILFFNEKGEVVLRLNGYLPPAQFKVALNYLIEKNEQLSFRDFIELNAPPPKAGKLSSEPFFLAPPYKLNRHSDGKGKPLAVFFEQKDCPNCEVLHQKVLTDAETRQLITRFDAVQLDMWDKTTRLTTPEGKATTARDWAKQLDVKYAPTIVLFDNEGKEIIRTEAFFKIFHTQSFFDYVQSGAYKQQPSFQRYISYRSEQLREQGKDVDIWRLDDEASMPKK